MRRPGEFGAIGVGALCIVSTLTWLSMIGLPYEVSTLERSYHLSDTLAGAVASLELIALAAVVALGSGPLARRDKRLVVIVGALLAIAASLGSMLAIDLPMLLAGRLAFGAGLGLIAISCNALPASHARPERLFAFMQVTVGVLFIVLMFGQPFVDAMVPRSGLFVTQLACLAAFGPLAVLLPRVEHASEGPTTTKAVIGLPLVLVLAGCVTFCMILGGAWGFTDQAGLSLGLPKDTVTWALTGSALANNIGPIAAAALGLRFGYAWPTALGCLAIGVCALLIYVSGHATAYIAGILMLNAVGSFLNPYTLGLLAEHDPTGVSSSLGAAALNFGLGAGPLIGGLLVVSFGQAGFGLALAGLSIAPAILVFAALVLIGRGHRLMIGGQAEASLASP